jgi:ABC-type Fe3+ transport system substrate-binding protein
MMKSFHANSQSVRVSCLVLIAAVGITGASVLAASSNPSLLKAKQEAEAKGYIFVSSRDEVVSKAKQEAKLRAVVSLTEDPLKHMLAAFSKKYPFIEIRGESVPNREGYLRMLHELKAGLTKGVDVNDPLSDYYNEYLPYQKKLDVLGMAEQKILNIPLQMVDPINRNIVVIGSSIQVVVYNKTLISAEQVPDTWEDFLKPEFRDRKFVLDIRPINISALVPAWGLEKALDYARKLAAQKPVWGRGHTALITRVLAGEHAIAFGVNYDSFLRARDKDKADRLGYKLLEPVPARLNESWSVLNSAEHPYAGLLMLEFVASPDGQKALDGQGQYEGSLFVRGNVQEQAVRGKKLSLVDWNHYTKTQEYLKKIVEAYGFPVAEK